jgi:hypothetical protein
MPLPAVGIALVGDGGHGPHLPCIPVWLAGWDLVSCHACHCIPWLGYWGYSVDLPIPPQNRLSDGPRHQTPTPATGARVVNPSCFDCMDYDISAPPPIFSGVGAPGGTFRPRCGRTMWRVYAGCSISACHCCHCFFFWDSEECGFIIGVWMICHHASFGGCGTWTTPAMYSGLARRVGPCVMSCLSLHPLAWVLGIFGGSSDPTTESAE